VTYIINGVCYQHYEQRLEQQKGRHTLIFALQKKIISKRNYIYISIQLSS